MRNKAIMPILICTAFILILFIYNQTHTVNRNFSEEIIIDLNKVEKLESPSINSHLTAADKYKIEKYTFQRPQIQTRTEEPRDLVVGEQTAYGDTIYYKIVHDIPMSVVADAVDMYALDKISGDVQLIYQTDSSFGIGYLNEFRCNNKYLFWVQLYDKGWKIYKMDLTSKRPILIREGKTFPGSILPSLSVSNEYVSWFEKNVEEDSFDLMLYSINEDELVVLSSGPVLKTPYDRAYIRDNTLAYLSEDVRGVKIEICDLETLETKTLLLPKDAQVENVYSNGKVTAWFENFKTSSIFVYDHFKHKLYSTEEYIFSMDLIEQSIFINTGDEIIAYDLKHKSRHLLVESNSQQRYIMATVTSDNKFIAYSDMSDGSVETTIVEISDSL